MTNLKPNMDEKDLAGHFTKYGDIVAIIHKGQYAFIEFAEASCAEDAVRESATNEALEMKV